MKLKHLLLIPPCIAPSLCRNLINQVTSMYILSRDAPILISVSLSANIGHIFDIGTLVKSITLTNITLALISVLELATSALISVILAYW